MNPYPIPFVLDLEIRFRADDHVLIWADGNQIADVTGWGTEGSAEFPADTQVLAFQVRILYK